MAGAYFYVRSGMKRSSFLFLAFGLSACWQDQQRQLAACDLEAIKLYPNQDFISSKGRLEAAIKLCMKAKGYTYTINPHRCEVVSDESESANPYCYVPSGRLTILVFDYEVGNPPVAKP